MSWKRFLPFAFALLLGLFVSTTPGRAQGPLYDKVVVDLPYTVTIGEHTLQPGNYTIRQMPSAANTRVLLIYSNDGMKFETSAMTIPALENRTPEDTKVVLHHFGNDYYFDRIWIQGKDYGYEFPLPNSVKARERERMQAATVAATYQAVSAEPSQPTAEAQPPAPAAQPTQPAEPAPVTQPAQPAEPAAPAEAAQPQQPVTTAPAVPQTADRMQNETLPNTADNWGLLIVAGLVVGIAGLVLRRKAWSL